MVDSNSNGAVSDASAPLSSSVQTPGLAAEVSPIPRILIGVSILSYSHEFVQSFLTFWTNLMSYQHKGRNFQVGYKFAYRRPVHMAQEELAQFAVDSGCSHLLLMDDDIYDVTIEDLFKLLDADKDVIGGIMHTSKFPHAMCAFRRYDLKTRVAEQPILDGVARLYEIPVEQRVGVQPADLIPFGFTLIKTDVFKRLQKPWFTCNTQAPTDSWFMDSVMDANIQPYAHFDVWLNHNGVTRQNKDVQMQLGYLNAPKTGVIAISQEEMRRHMITMDMKMKEAEKHRKSCELQAVTFYNKLEGGDNVHETSPELSK